MLCVTPEISNGEMDSGKTGKMAVYSLLSYVVRNHSDMEIYGQTAGKNQEKVHGQSGALYYCMADTDIRTAVKKRTGGDNAG